VARGRRWSMLEIGSVTVAALAGVAMGAGAFTFVYAQGASYLGSDPASCANCHIMADHFSAWRQSSHRSVAVCNDCHSPASPIPKLFVKAVNGWNHSVAFTTGNFPEPLRITRFNEKVTENACRSCHEPIVQAIDTHPGAKEGMSMSCIRCHDQVGHPL
jgi:cytochrome c nitrite reductase small subunit